MSVLARNFSEPLMVLFPPASWRARVSFSVISGVSKPLPAWTFLNESLQRDLRAIHLNA